MCRGAAATASTSTLASDGSLLTNDVSGTFIRSVTPNGAILTVVVGNGTQVAGQAYALTVVATMNTPTGTVRTLNLALPCWA